MDKKAQGISLNVIVVAAIALIVMVVLILVFTGKIAVFSQETDICQRKGGVCLTDDDNDGVFCSRDNLESEISALCDLDGDGVQDSDRKCCIKIGK